MVFRGTVGPLPGMPAVILLMRTKPDNSGT